MVKPKYPRGSEWRRWDLHLHTPAVILNNQFEGNNEADKWERFVSKLETLTDTAVLGITDYFEIRGYYKLMDYKNSNRLSNIDLILPNVELRMLPVTASEHPINVHFIFNPEIVDRLQSMFFQNLDFRYGGNSYKCTRDDLIRLGHAYKVNETNDEACFIEGINQYKVTPSQLKILLDANKDLSENCIIAVANSSRDGNSGIQEDNLTATRREIYRLANIVFSGNPKDTIYFLGKGSDPEVTVKTNYGSLKPCIIGSDAHALNKIGVPDFNRHTWIKADPTFEGLKQVLHEPEDRVFIGLVPPAIEAQRARPTRIMSEIHLRKSADAKIDEKWFDGAMIPLNPELIAIIGNKGSGKSALADVMGLLGNTTCYKAFSFLHEDRFRNKGKAKQFQASLRWVAETTESWITLDQNPAVDSVEKVKYIPQKYLESICDEIVLGKESPFYAELEQVIFSHVPIEERLKLSTLVELLEHRGKETKQAIGLLVGEIWEINKAIIAIEDRLTEKNQKSIQNQLEEKRRELLAHETNKPKEKLSPVASEDTRKESERVAELLKTKRESLKKIEENIASIQMKLSEIVQDHSKAEKLLTKVNNLEHYIENFRKDVTPDIIELKLNLSEIVSIKIIKDPIVNLLKDLSQNRKALAIQLEESSPGCYKLQHRNISAEISTIEGKLGAPQREYQEYLNTLKKWESLRDALLGTETISGSLKFYEYQLRELDILPESLNQLYKERKRKVFEIYREKSKLRGYYSSYYGEVQRFLNSHELAKSGQFKMSFNVSISESGFAEAFFKMINQRKIGAFSGTEDGTTKLKQLLSTTNFDSVRATIRFVQKLMKRLKYYEGKELQVADQLRQEASVKEFYSLLFSLGYLDPQYNLQWDGKALSQLSPGERGNLLLIFFLLVDKDDRPLIIDQPEENLDNQTVYKTLVPCIKNAKKRRQIILVTHNPNLAVVCDADQIIYSSINKDNKNEVVYETGSLEDPVINSRVIDVLEGTRPAFDKRDDKYLAKKVDY